MELLKKKKKIPPRNCALEPSLHPIYSKITKLGDEENPELFFELSGYFIQLVFGIVSKVCLVSGKLPAC